MGGQKRRSGAKSKWSKASRKTIAGAFIAHRLEMRESPAWQALPDNARRVLDRLEVEHCRHGGSENGSLICTYGDFEKAGVRRASVSKAIRQCSALGFIKVNRLGYRPQKAHRAPSSYTLTYITGGGDSPPCSDEWQRIKDPSHAAFVLRQADEPPQEEKALTNGSHPPVDIDSRLDNAPRL